ncbi:MAG: class I SAM-dependent methyltransferase [Desmonostoc geniculatum HA4340-LM1]|jgi:SAM-dependent methyltransferase|nr:class I SAM-dependent methyltransferase [Desmonostoc geniculatum HA4340-LM1]
MIKNPTEKMRTNTTDLFQGIKTKIDFNPHARDEYEKRVVSQDRLLDIGGRNSYSVSRQRIDLLNRNPNNIIVSTDVIADYQPDLIDDICNTKIEPNSFSGIYCNAVLEHVQEYWKAIDNIYNILEDKGEAFFYVPFFWSFHDQMDYHRFTFTEVARMLGKFSEIKILCPGDAQGFGFVFWYILTISNISKFPKIGEFLSKITNFLLKIYLLIIYNINKRKIKEKYDNISWKEYCFYYIFLYINHGFCAWVKK